MRQARKRPQTRAIPVLMISAESSLGKVDEAMERLGVNDYLTKPFGIADFNARLEPIVQALGARRAAPKPRDAAAARRVPAVRRKPVEMKRVIAMAVLGLGLLLAIFVGFDVGGEDAENIPLFWQGSLCTGTLVNLSASEAVVDVGGTRRKFRVDGQTRFTARGVPGNPTPGSKVQVRFSGGGTPRARLIRLLSAPATKP